MIISDISDISRSQPTILWDFGGTLVHFTNWRGALMDVLDEYEPGHGIDQEQIRPLLRDGFPWHKPEESHLHLSQPEAWWANLEPLFVKTYQRVGFNTKRSRFLAKQVRRHMIDHRRYILYEDTIPVLKYLVENGWRHVILSNHMPELPEVVKALGLSQFIEACFVSAVTGYEKPNPEAFRIALSALGNPGAIWMVGDNFISDIKGAETAGIPAILVHSSEPGDVKYRANNLFDAAKIIRENQLVQSASPFSNT